MVVSCGWGDKKLMTNGRGGDSWIFYISSIANSHILPLVHFAYVSTMIALLPMPLKATQREYIHNRYKPSFQFTLM